MAAFFTRLVGWGSIWEDVFADRIKILALVPPKEKYQPLYFVSRAQTMIKIQPDITNTRKGQDWAGRRAEHRLPSWGWYLVNSNFELAEGDLARPWHTVPTTEQWLMWPCCHFLSGSSLNSLV